MANELRHADVGTALSKAEWEAVGSHIFNNQAAGDIPYASSTSQLSRLGIGSAKQILSVNSAGTAPEWVSSPAVVTALVPDAADGATIGTAALEFSDVYLADGAVVYFGNDQDVSLTHVADTGLLLNSTMAIQFNDASQYINAPTNAILDINATDEIELNATLADVNANLDVSGTYTGGGLMTTGGNIVIPNAGNIGSASDTDAIAISSGGVVTMNQIPVFSAGINVSGGTIAGTLATAAQGNVTSLGTLTTLTVDNIIINGTNIGHTSDTDSIAIASDGVVTMNQIPVFSAGINVSGGTIAGTLATAAQGNVTSLGTLTALTVDNVSINGTTIGHTSDTDLMTLADGVLTIAGEISTTTLDIGGTNVTTTAAELNVIDGDTARGTTAIADGDGVLINDAGTMRMTTVQTLAAYLDDEITAMPNLVTTGTIGTGVWEATDVAVAHGGTGASTLTDGGILLGSGTNAITAMAVLADGEMIVGDGTTDPVAESGATLRTSIGLGTANAVEFAGLTATTGAFTGDVTITGTTPLLTIGDNADEDTGLIFAGHDGSSNVDYHMGFDAGDNSFVIGTGTAIGAGGTRMLAMLNSNIVLGHPAEVAPLDYYQVLIRGDWTSGGSYNRAATLSVGSDLTGHSGDDAFLAHVLIGTGAGGSITTAGNATTIASLYLTEPDISTSHTVTNSATLYIEAAASEATNDYALWVDSGVSRFDDSIHVTTIDFTDGDLAMTIADGGTVTFDDYVGMGGTATAFTAAAGLAIKKNGDNLYLEQSNADNGWIIQTLDSSGALSFERRGEGGSPSNTERMSITTAGDVTVGSSLQVGTIDYTDGDLAITINDTGTTTFAQAATFSSSVSVSANAYIYRGDTGYEGGQLNFGRATDNAIGWAIDSFGNAAADSLRFLHGEWSGTVAAQFVSSNDTFYVYQSMQVSGTTPNLIIGDGGDENNSLYFDGSDSNFLIQQGTDGILRLYSQAHTSANSGGSYIANHAFTPTGIGVYQYSISGAFTGSGTSNRTAAVVLASDITGVNGDTGFLSILNAGVHVGSSIATQDNSETVDQVATVYFSEPDLTANDTVTNASTLYIQNAPTEGTNNYALFVDTGASRFDGSIGIGRTAANVGSIGTTMLDVYGDSPIVRISNTAEDDAGIVFDDNNDPTAQNFQILYHSGDEDLTIRSDQADNILKMSAAGVSTFGSLVLFANGSASAPAISNASDTNTGMFFQAADTLGFALGGSEEFRMEADGDFHADGDVYAFSGTVSSDIALKKNIVVIPNALDKVSQLNGVSWDWKDDSRGSSVGLVAQNVEKIFPELVKDAPSLKEGVSSHKNLNYNGIIGLLVESIKELKEEITELKNADRR